MCPLRVSVLGITSSAGCNWQVWAAGAAGALCERRLGTAQDAYIGSSQLRHQCERCQGKNTPEGLQPLVTHNKVEESQ